MDGRADGWLKRYKNRHGVKHLANKLLELTTHPSLPPSIQNPSALLATGCGSNILRRSVQTSINPWPQIPAAHLCVVTVKNKMGK